MSLVPVSGGANAFARPAGAGGAEHARPPGDRRADRSTTRPSPGCRRRSINSYKRLMPGLIAGYWANWGLDNRFSTYRVPAERGRGDAHREPHAVRDGEPVPRRGGDAERRAARRRRRRRLRRPAARRRRRRAEHRPPHAAHARRGARRRRGRHRARRGDGPRARRAPTSPCAATRSPAGRPPARRGTPSRSPPGSSTATCRSTDPDRNGSRGRPRSRRWLSMSPQLPA